MKVFWWSSHVITCSAARSCSVSCRPGLQYISGDGWDSRCRWQSPALARADPTSAVSKKHLHIRESHIPLAFQWRAFSWKTCTQGVSSSGIHACVGKAVEPYFENVLYSVQLAGRKQGADISPSGSLQTKYHVSPKSNCFSDSLCVLC